jgi:hypothetical protein
VPDTIIADVSEFQGAIDWAAYGAAVPGVIVRAHNGFRPDHYWSQNLPGARAHVGWRAWYQYLPASVDPVAAAHAFQATTGPLLPGEVAILDLEEGAGDQRGRRQAWLDALRDPIEWTYTGAAFARAHLPGVGVQWLAAYGQGEPTDSHTLWQFTNARVFPGIAHPCDASVYHGLLTSTVASTITTLGPVTTAPTLTPPAPLTPEETDMPVIIESPGSGLWLDTGAGELAGIGSTVTADAYTTQGFKRVVMVPADFARLRAARAGRELIVNPTMGYAVGTPGGKYVGLADLAEVQFHQQAGCAQRSVTPGTFTNLTRG